jgi:hypothetical protein
MMHDRPGELLLTDARSYIGQRGVSKKYDPFWSYLQGVGLVETGSADRKDGG